MEENKPALSPRRLAACRANIHKAHEANRQNPLSPARRAALARATEANRRNFRLTPARLRAMGANIRKMQAGSVQKFQMTDARRRANLANLPTAWAAPRSAEGLARSSRNRLQLGLQSRDFEATLPAFGESLREYRAHVRSLERALEPQDDAERALIRRLAEAIWLRFRLFRAQARWEGLQFARRLREIRRDRAQHTPEMCAGLVMLALLEDDWDLSLDGRLTRRIERLLRRLMRWRREGAAARTSDDWTESDREELEQMAADPAFVQRLLAGLTKP